MSGSGATITNCHSTVNYTVSRTSTVMNATGGFLEVGGLLGIQASATVENSTYTGSITVTCIQAALRLPRRNLLVLAASQLSLQVR